MKDILSHLGPLLSAPSPVFVCTEARELFDVPFAVRIRSKLAKPASRADLAQARKLVGDTNNQLLEFYSRSNGLILFEQPETGEAVLHLLPIRSWQRRTLKFQREASSANGPVSGNMAAAIVIGEPPQSANYLVVLKSGPGAGAVCIYDHETLGLKKLASSFEGFLKLLARANPVELTNDVFGCFARFTNPTTKGEAPPVEYHASSRTVTVVDSNRIQLRGEPISLTVPSGFELPTRSGMHAVMHRRGPANRWAAINVEIGLSFRVWHSIEEELRLCLNGLPFEKLRWQEHRKTQVRGMPAWEAYFDASFDCRDLPENRIWRISGLVMVVPVMGRGFKAACYATTKRELSQMREEFRRFLDSIKYDPTMVHIPESALAELACYGDHKGMKSLLKNGAIPDGRDDQGISALVRCTELGSRDGVKLLLKYGADPNLPGLTGSALVQAMESDKCDAEMVTLLLRSGSNPNTIIPGRGTILRKAVDRYLFCCKREFRKKVEVLLKHGADPSLKHRDQSTIEYAQELGLKDLVLLFRRK